MKLIIRNVDRSDTNQFYFRLFLDTEITHHDDEFPIEKIGDTKYLEAVSIDCDNLPINKRIKMVLCCMKRGYNFEVKF
jgi:hypothetical protein